MIPCTWILVVFYFLLAKYLPLFTLQVAPNSQKDRQAITMANHIYTSKQIHYVYYTSQHWLFWIYIFFPRVKRPLQYDMHNERWTRNMYIFTITYRGIATVPIHNCFPKICYWWKMTNNALHILIVSVLCLLYLWQTSTSWKINICNEYCDLN
jgi:hypothetical protein